MGLCGCCAILTGCSGTWLGSGRDVREVGMWVAGNDASGGEGGLNLVRLQGRHR